jgi:hypothetical protein
MASTTPVPYDIKVRRDRFVPDDLDDATAAGIVAAGCDIEVTAVYPAGSAEGTPGEPARDIYASVYPVVTGDGNEARHSYPSGIPGGARGLTALRAALLRAQRIEDMAGALMRGEPVQAMPEPGTPEFAVLVTSAKVRQAVLDAGLTEEVAATAAAAWDVPEPSEYAPRFPHVDEDDKAALLAERTRLINALATVEEALREKHGSEYRTV